MQKYYYLCTQRPACPGAIPRGITDIIDTDYETTGAYNMIVYDRKLTDQEIYDFELKEDTNNGVSSVG